MTRTPDPRLPPSQRVFMQSKDTPWKEYTEHRTKYRIRVHLRYDDSCKNGHNTFAITGTIDRWEVRHGYASWVDDAGGCLHEEIVKHFPAYAPYIKWHLTSSDGPMHYVENTLYWLGWSGWCDGRPNSPPNLQHARKTAVWPELPETFLAPLLPGDIAGGKLGLFKPLTDPIKQALNERLPALMQEFKRDMEALGFIY
jgi:hypothetical protein